MVFLLAGAKGSIYTVHLCVKKENLIAHSPNNLTNKSSNDCCCRNSTLKSENCTFKKGGGQQNSFAVSKKSCCSTINAYFNFPLYQPIKVNHSLYFNQVLLKRIMLLKLDGLVSILIKADKVKPVDIFIEVDRNEIYIAHCVFLI